MKGRLLDYIDFDRVNALLEGFNQSTGFVTAILDLEGNILSRSGWRQICTEFHRVHADSSRNCTYSDTVLAGKLGESESYHYYQCLNGLVDVAVPLVIKGEHIANLFSGQFFFEEPDRSFFREQARRYGFREEEYMEALDSVPVVSQEKVKLIMDFLLKMTQLITEMTLQRMELTELNESLKISEERYRLILENSMDAILLTSPDGRILSANKAACEIFQLTEEEICRVGRNGISDLEDPRLYTLIEERHKTGKAKGEILMIRADGTRFPVELSTSVFTDQDGELRSSMIIRDITERKAADEELRTSQEKFNMAFHNSPDAIIISRASDGLIMEVNQSFYRISGFTPDDIKGRTTKEINIWASPDERNRYTSILKEKKQVFGFDTLFRTKSGEEINLIVSGEISELKGEQYIIGILHDITERTQAEKRIADSEKRYRSLFENMTAGFVLFEVILNDTGMPVDLIILDANNGFEAATGLKSREVIGQRLTKVLPGIESDAADWIGTYGKVALTGQACQFEQGSEMLGFYFTVNAYQSGPNQCAVAFTDITIRKKAEQELHSMNTLLEERVKMRTAELEAANQELENFTYSVSHDLKAPLRGIDGYSSLLISMYGEALNDEARSFLKTIRSSTLQMNKLIEDLLEYSRLERKQNRIVGFEIRKVVDVVISRYTEDLVARNIELILNIPDIEITADDTGIEIALRNLLENAIKFTVEKSEPQIVIGLNELPDAWIISVKDNGIGFDMKYQKRIFELFQRLHRTEDYHGTGIGLAMVSKAMQRMKGKVYADSTPGVGSEFFLEIPKP